MLAIVCPGQGAQSPGMLSPWLELAPARESLEASADAAGLDLIALGTTADADTIRDTAIAQPLLVATALAAYAALDGVVPGVVAGHSVGEFSAAAVAGVLSPADAVRLVRCARRRDGAGRRGSRAHVDGRDSRRGRGRESPRHSRASTSLPRT